MNLRRGFFRLWLLFSALFVIATALATTADQLTYQLSGVHLTGDEGPPLH
jgi:hypothetical protein